MLDDHHHAEFRTQFVREPAALRRFPALVLNADYRPLSYYPLSLWPWQEAIKAINKAVADARHNPETARSLFALAANGRRHDPESLERLRTAFSKDGIPLKFLSHYAPDEPFACLTLNNALYDKF